MANVFRATSADMSAEIAVFLNVSGRRRTSTNERSGGEGGIRTPDTVARMPHFECGAFNHSATSPRGRVRAGARGRGRFLEHFQEKWKPVFSPRWRLAQRAVRN